MAVVFPNPLPFLELALIVKADAMASLVTSLLCGSNQWREQ